MEKQKLITYKINEDDDKELESEFSDYSEEVTLDFQEAITEDDFEETEDS